MVEYKVNLRFQEYGKSLNELLTNVLKIELEKYINMTYDVLNRKKPFKLIHDSENEESTN